MGQGLKQLSGDDVLNILEGFGFGVWSQKGSHIKLRRVINGMKQTLIVPHHRAMSPGTLRSIFNQTSIYIPQAELRPHFYNE